MKNKFITSYSTLFLISILWLLHLPLKASDTASNNSNCNVTIEKQINGYIWKLNRQNASFLNGCVYQPVPDDRHIDDYVKADGYYELYKKLLPPESGGLGHAKELKEMNVDFIRIYQLSTLNKEDISKTKELFQSIYEQYGIRVLLGNWAGLHKDPLDYEGIQKDLEDMIKVYGSQEWILCFLIGNENNYFHNDGILRNENTPHKLRIELSVLDYYNFMNRLAKTAKRILKELGVQKPVGLGCGEIFPSEIEAFKKEVHDFDFIGYNCYRTPDRLNDYVILLKQRGISLPVLITEFGIPVGGTALWGFQGMNPFSEKQPFILSPVKLESAEPKQLLSVMQKNYLREQFPAAIEAASAIVENSDMRNKAMNNENGSEELNMIFAEALLIRGLSYKNIGLYDKALLDFKDVLLNFSNVSIWSLPIDPVTDEERANIYWNGVRMARKNHLEKGSQNVIGICCFEFTSEHWNNTEQNRGFMYKPADDVKVDGLLDLSVLKQYA